VTRNGESRNRSPGLAMAQPWTAIPKRIEKAMRYASGAEWARPVGQIPICSSALRRPSDRAGMSSARAALLLAHFFR
jgi:hypothetical protein